MATGSRGSREPIMNIYSCGRIGSSVPIVWLDGTGGPILLLYKLQLYENVSAFDTVLIVIEEMKNDNFKLKNAK